MDTREIIPVREWPPLEWAQWSATAETLHMMVQIVGKTRLALTATQNHWWNVPLYVTVSGLSTSIMPLPDGRFIDIEFDFVAHMLRFKLSSGQCVTQPLVAQSISAFFAAYLDVLRSLDITVAIDAMPVECVNPIVFDQDSIHQSYDRDQVARLWQVLCRIDALFKRFSTGFLGKISPVHFFWGSFDLAVTRYNGRIAPPREGADPIQREAYSHECISAGFWPGNGGFGQAAFYCYAAPVPAGLEALSIPGLGAFNKTLGEFVLLYDDVTRSSNAEQQIMDFFLTTYDRCARQANWDRETLDRPLS